MPKAAAAAAVFPRVGPRAPNPRRSIFHLRNFEAQFFDTTAAPPPPLALIHRCIFFLIVTRRLAKRAFVKFGILAESRGFATAAVRWIYRESGCSSLDSGKWVELSRRVVRAERRGYRYRNVIKYFSLLVEGLGNERAKIFFVN